MLASEKVTSLAHSNLRKPFNSGSICERESIWTVHGSQLVPHSFAALQLCWICESNSSCFRSYTKEAFVLSVSSPVTPLPKFQALERWKGTHLGVPGRIAWTQDKTALIYVHWLYRVLSCVCVSSLQGRSYNTISKFCLFYSLWYRLQIVGFVESTAIYSPAAHLAHTRDRTE